VCILGNISYLILYTVKNENDHLYQYFMHMYLCTHEQHVEWLVVILYFTIRMMLFDLDSTNICLNLINLSIKTAPLFYKFVVLITYTLQVITTQDDSATQVIIIHNNILII